MPIVTVSRTEALDALQRARDAGKRIKEKASEMAERTIGLAATVGGGASAGFVDAEYSDKNLVGIKLNWAIGGALAAAGLANVAGAQSTFVERFGAGLLAYQAGREVYDRQVNKGASAGVGARLSGGGARAQLAGGQGRAVTHEELLEQFEKLRTA